MKSLFLILLALLGSSGLWAQSSTDPSEWNRSNQFYVTWGYNRSHYRPSDISFKGEGFDFTLADVEAHDDPEPFDSKVYLNPKKFTIPQFSFRVGYYLGHDLSISCGWDHMKYVVQSSQSVGIDGYIEPSLDDSFGGVYDNDFITLSPSLLEYEHTDGLNFVRFGIEKHAPLLHSKNQKFKVNIVAGLNTGLMVPWTDFRFFGERYENSLHLSGWALSFTMAPRISYGRHIFLQWQTQLGYISMGDIKLQDELDSRASQQIWFNETSVSLGLEVPISVGGRRNDRATELE